MLFDSKVRPGPIMSLGVGEQPQDTTISSVRKTERAY